jgi:hypothetical protein
MNPITRMPDQKVMERCRAGFKRWDSGVCKRSRQGSFSKDVPAKVSRLGWSERWRPCGRCWTAPPDPDGKRVTMRENGGQQKTRCFPSERGHFAILVALFLRFARQSRRADHGRATDRRTSQWGIKTAQSKPVLVPVEKFIVPVGHCHGEGMRGRCSSFGVAK